MRSGNPIYWLIQAIFSLPGSPLPIILRVRSHYTIEALSVWTCDIPFLKLPNRVAEIDFIEMEFTDAIL